MNHVFEVVSGVPRAGTVHILPAGNSFIGREPDCQIRLDSYTVARHHALIESSASASCFIRDTMSVCGTRVNGTRIQERTELQAGDLIQLGIVVLKYLGSRPSPPEGVSAKEP